MSKNNKNKGKGVQMQPISAERYITERARKLPIDKCLMPEDLFEKGLGSIFVIRKMSNGNYVLGTYLVDTLCLGLKDTYYYYNMDESDLEDLLERFEENEDLVETPYVEVHNIIYGAIAWAEDLGFKPQKDWKVSQFVLEEDTDDIELIEYEYGKNGKPIYVQGPYDDSKMILATLNRSLGEGNYGHTHQLFKDFGFDEDFDFDDFSYIEEDEMMEIAKMAGYEGEELESFNITIDDDFEDVFDTDEMERDDEDLLLDIEDKLYEEKNMKILDDFIIKYPTNTYLQLKKYYALSNMGMEDEARKFNEQYLVNNPEILFSKGIKARKLLRELKVDEAYQLMGGVNHLKELFPDKDYFYKPNFIEFYTVQGYIAIVRKDKSTLTKILKLLDEIDPKNEIFDSLDKFKEEFAKGNLYKSNQEDFFIQ